MQHAARQQLAEPIMGWGDSEGSEGKRHKEINNIAYSKEIKGIT